MEYVNILRLQGTLVLLFSMCVILPEKAIGIPRRHYCENYIAPNPPNPPLNPPNPPPPPNPPQTPPNPPQTPPNPPQTPPNPPQNPANPPQNPTNPPQNPPAPNPPQTPPNPPQNPPNPPQNPPNPPQTPPNPPQTPPNPPQNPSNPPQTPSNPPQTPPNPPPNPPQNPPNPPPPPPPNPLPNPPNGQCISVKIIGNYPVNGRGTVSKLPGGGLDYYESLPTSPPATRALIALHDAGGFRGRTGNVRQVVDQLSECFNFRIMMPNFQNVGVWTLVKPGVQAAITHIKSEWGINQIGIFGWSDGGHAAFDAAKELDADLKAAVLLHPNDIDQNNDFQEANDVKIPIYFIISGDEEKPQFEAMVQILNDRGIDTGLEWYDQAYNGYAGDRGTFGRPPYPSYVRNTITSMGRFFEKHVK